MSAGLIEGIRLVVGVVLGVGLVGGLAAMLLVASIGRP